MYSHREKDKEERKMARFCTKCGRPLQEGEVCNCTAQNAGGAQQSQAGGQQYQQQRQPGGQQYQQQRQPGGQQYYQQGQPGGQQYYQQGQPGGQQYYQQGQQGGMTKEAEWLNRQKDVIMSGTKSMFSEIGPIIKSPVSRVKELAASNNAMIGIQFIVAKTIIALIMILIYLAVMQGKLDDLGGVVDMPWFKAIMTTLFLTAGVDFLEAYFLKIFTGVFNGNTNYNAMLTVIGARAIYDTIILVLVIFLMLLSMKVGIGFNMLFSPIIVFVQFAAYRSCVRLDENKKPYAYFIAKICISIVGALIVYMMFKETIDLFLGAFDAMESVLNGDLGGMLNAF